MSSWSFEVKVDMSRLLSISGRLGSIGELLFDAAEETAKEVKKNIQQKNIIDSGALLDSIQAARHGDEASVSDGVSYGVYNEFGTDKMAARPFFMPAIENAGDTFDKKFTEIFK